MSKEPSDLPETIGALMGAVLVRAPLGAAEDFFDAGGDSLGAVEVLQRLAAEPAVVRIGAAEELQAALLEAIFEDASPGALAEVCAGYARPSSASAPGESSR